MEHTFFLLLDGLSKYGFPLVISTIVCWILFQFAKRFPRLLDKLIDFVPLVGDKLTRIESVLTAMLTELPIFQEDCKWKRENITIVRDNVQRILDRQEALISSHERLCTVLGEVRSLWHNKEKKQVA